MIYKIAAAGDLHRRHKDISTIEGYDACTDKVCEDLENFIVNQGITHFFSLGDWYDRGFVDDVSAALSCTSFEHHLHNILKGNLYGVIGNHLRLRLDSNPELSLIQPHSVYKPRKPVKRDYQIIRTPSHVVLGSVQISLVHFRQDIESVDEYEIQRLPNISYHVALVHDPRFIPYDKIHLTNIPSTNSTNTQIGRVLSNVDLCICGDIHTPLGMFKVGEKTKMYVPGSLTNTNAGEKGRHGVIKIPILTIDTDKNTIGLSFYEFDLNINMLTFNIKKTEELSNKMKTLAGNNIKHLYNDSGDNIISSTLSTNTYGSFLREQKYEESDKALIKATIKKPDDVMSLVSIFYEANNIKEEIPNE